MSIKDKIWITAICVLFAIMYAVQVYTYLGEVQ